MTESDDPGPEPSPGSPAVADERSGSGSERNRRAWLVAAGAAIAVVAVAAWLLWPSDGPSRSVTADSGPAKGAQRRGGATLAKCPDQLFVYLAQGVTDADVAGIRSALSTTYGADEVVYMDREQTYREFKDNFADQPDLVDSVRPDDLSETFRISSDSDWTAAEIAEIRELSGVSSVEVGGESLLGESCRPDTGDTGNEDAGGTTDPCADSDRVFIYMELNSTEADLAGVRSALSEVDGAGDVVFMDTERTYQEFRRLFADQPQFVDSVKPEDLPVSFRASTDVPWKAAEFARFEALPGVRSVEGGNGTAGAPCGADPTDEGGG